MNKILTEHLKSWRADRPDEWTMDGFIKKALALEQENAKLKAKLMNIEEGLKRLDDKMAYGDYAIHSETGDHVCLYNGFLERSELSAPTLSGLIDKILTGGE